MVQASFSRAPLLFAVCWSRCSCSGFVYPVKCDKSGYRYSVWCWQSALPCQKIQQLYSHQGFYAKTNIAASGVLYTFALHKRSCCPHRIGAIGRAGGQCRERQSSTVLPSLANILRNLQTNPAPQRSDCHAIRLTEAFGCATGQTGGAFAPSRSLWRLSGDAYAVTCTGTAP